MRPKGEQQTLADPVDRRRVRLQPRLPGSHRPGRTRQPLDALSQRPPD